MSEPDRVDSRDASRRTERTLHRRRYLQAATAVTGMAVIAGCGGPGAGVETDGTPNGIGEGTPTDAAMETDTDEGPATDAATETGTPDGDARVRAAHLSPDAPNVDVSIDDEVVLEAVAYGDVSDYLDVPAGAHTVEITAAGDVETTVFEDEVTVETDQDYTVAAIGEVSEGASQPFDVLVLTDDNEPPDDETARLRVVHASPDAPAVDVTADDTVLFEGVAFGDADAVEVPAGSYTVEIRAAEDVTTPTDAGSPAATETDGGTPTAAGTDTPTATGMGTPSDDEPVATFDVDLAGGQVLTAFAAGYLAPEDAPADAPFDLIVTQDTDGDMA